MTEKQASFAIGFVVCLVISTFAYSFVVGQVFKKYEYVKLFNLSIETNCECEKIVIKLLN